MLLSVFLCVLCVYGDVWSGVLTQLSVFLCVLSVYADVSSGQESDATICISVCITCVW